MKKTQSIKQIQSKLWDHCRRITRAKYIRDDGNWNCFTCGHLIDAPYKAQTGHFIPSGSCGAFLRYDLRNIRIQCYNCNINLGGNGAEYYIRMVKENGQECVDQVFKDKQKIVKAVDHYIELISQYEKL